MSAAPLRMFIPLTKVDAETRTVYGIATGETVDRSGEICDYASTKPLYEAWSGDISKASGGKSLGNLRAMHGKVAAGKVTSIAFNDGAKQIEIAAKVVDDNEWNKVVEGVYTGFSQGGAYAKRWTDGDGLTRYTADPTEVSLVDLPCLPEATFQVIKAAGAVETKHFKPVVDPQPTNAEVNAKATEMAKAAGREHDVADFFEPARAALIKAALPAPVETPATATASEPSATPPVPGDGLEQVWKARDGATFAKKADALAHNAGLDVASQGGAKAALDAIDQLGDLLGINKGDVPDGKGAKKPGEGKDQAAGGGATDTNASAAKPARIAPTGQAMKFAGPEDLAKNLFRVSRLAELLGSLRAMQENAEVDALYGFGQPQDPAIGEAMKAWLAQGCGLLIQIVQLESDKLMGDLDDDTVVLAACARLRPGHYAALDKASAAVPSLAKVLDGLEKKGARNSKADQDKIQAMHDHACDLGANCDADNCPDDDASKAAGGNRDLTKAIADMTAGRDAEKARGDALQKMIDDKIVPTLGEILKRVGNIERQPLPLPLQGGTRAVSKGAESADAGDLAEQLTKLKAEDPNAYAVLMIKAAQSQPQQMTLAR